MGDEKVMLFTRLDISVMFSKDSYLFVYFRLSLTLIVQSLAGASHNSTAVWISPVTKTLPSDNENVACLRLEVFISPVFSYVIDSRSYKRLSVLLLVQ